MHTHLATDVDGSLLLCIHCRASQRLRAFRITTNTTTSNTAGSGTTPGAQPSLGAVAGAAAGPSLEERPPVTPAPGQSGAGGFGGAAAATAAAAAAGGSAQLTVSAAFTMAARDVAAVDASHERCPAGSSGCSVFRSCRDLLLLRTDGQLLLYRGGCGCGGGCGGAACSQVPAAWSPACSARRQRCVGAAPEQQQQQEAYGVERPVQGARVLSLSCACQGMAWGQEASPNTTRDTCPCCGWPVMPSCRHHAPGCDCAARQRRHRAQRGPARQPSRAGIQRAQHAHQPGRLGSHV